jgi:multidrug efflux pump subunit AcrA (membrane-fusion protein)
LPLILKGILGNSSLSNRNELIAALDKMSQPNPEQQQQAQMQQQAAMAKLQADLALLQAQTQKATAEAQQTMVETQLMPEELRVKVVQAAATNLDQDADFAKRMKLADLCSKRKILTQTSVSLLHRCRIVSLNKQMKGVSPYG